MAKTGMTAEEKKDVAFFIDLASDLIRGGYSRGERSYDWVDAVQEKNFTTNHTNRALKCDHEQLVALSPLVMVITGDTDADEAVAGLLEKMLASIGLSEGKNCIITDTVDCESAILSHKPRFILCLGEPALQALLGEPPVGKLRGKITDYGINGMAIPLYATYHPCDLLRDGSLKRPAWDDLKLLRAALEPYLGGAK